MEELVLDGKNYVKASKAARDLGYATDYVGQLCRSGQVDAHLIGRTWYVHMEQLSTHRVEKKRMSRIKAREYAKKSIEEHRLKINKSQNNYKNIDIRYEHDTEELIPETRRVSIVSEKVSQSAPNEDREPNIVTENKGEKVIMSGDISVVDVTDEPSDPDTTMLTSVLTRKPTHAQKVAVAEVSDDNQEGEMALDSVRSSPRVKQSFMQRLETQIVAAEPTQEDYQEPVMRTSESNIIPLQRSSNLISVSFLVIMLLLTLASIPLAIRITYSATNAAETGTSFYFSTQEAMDIIISKI